MKCQFIVNKKDVTCLHNLVNSLIADLVQLLIQNIKYRMQEHDYQPIHMHAVPGEDHQLRDLNLKLRYLHHLSSSTPLHHVLLGMAVFAF